MSFSSNLCFSASVSLKEKKDNFAIKVLFFLHIGVYPSTKQSSAELPVRSTASIPASVTTSSSTELPVRSTVCIPTSVTTTSTQYLDKTQSVPCGTKKGTFFRKLEKHTIRGNVFQTKICKV